MGKAQTRTKRTKPEAVWANPRRAGKKHKGITEQQKENARLIKEIIEMQKETDRLQKETAQQMKETDKRLGKQLGELSNRFGEVIESMVEPNLLVQFSELGFDFDRIHHGTKIKDKQDNILAEVDYSLENNDYAMIVEVKAKLKFYDIEYHIERIQKMRVQFDRLGDKRVILGAFAGTIISDSVKKLALKKGFYIIKPSGKTFIITVPEKVKEWRLGEQNLL